MKFEHKVYLALAGIFLLYCFWFLSFENGACFLLTFIWVIFLFYLTLCLINYILEKLLNNMMLGSKP